jgi:hypothetical protein
LEDFVNHTRKLRLAYRSFIFKAAAAAAAVFASTSALPADTRTWDGGGGLSSSWQNAVNWNPDVVPTSIADITLGNAVTAASLMFAPNAGMAVNSILINTTNPFGFQAFPAFKNNPGAGHFSIESTSTDLLIHFSAVPEPTALAIFAAAGALGLRRRRIFKESRR